MKLQWKTYKHSTGKIASIEATITKHSFPGLSDTHRATILPGENGQASAYITLRDGQMSTQSRWANKVFSSIQAAKAWSRKQLVELSR